MVTHFVYELTFIDHVRFKQCPKFLLYKTFFKHLKKLTCLETHQTCNGCVLRSRCLYHKYSGENFATYPALLVKRNLIEKQNFRAGDSLVIEFYALAATSLFGYIEGFFNHMTTLVNTVVRVKLIKKDVLSSENLYDQVFQIMTPLVNFMPIEQMNYYDQAYGCRLDIGDYEIVGRMRTVQDRRIYHLDSNKVVMSGDIGSIRVTWINRIWIEIGLGYTNFLGGGQLK